MFISHHHVMSLATSTKNELSVCSLFYVYDKKSKSFIVASSDTTLHISHILQNKKIAGNILLETQKVGEIQGLQFRGEFLSLEEETLKEKYFESFPYAREMSPKLWHIQINYFKLTDNALGFANKLILEI